MPPRQNKKAYVNPKLGSKGLNVYDTARSIGEFQMRRLTNMIPNTGGCKSQYGYEVYNTDTGKTGGITMLHGFRSADGTKKQLIFSNDDDYYYLPVDTADSGTAWSTIGDYGTAVDTPHAYTCNDFVIFGTGTTGTPKKWNGTTFSSITTRPVATYDIHFFEFFQGQNFAALFGAGDPSNPSRLYYSDANNPDVWSGGAAGYIDIAKNDGYKITGLKMQGEQLIVYKERNRYYVSTFYESGAGVYGVRVQPFKDNSGGAVAHDTIHVLYNGDIISLANKGIGMQGVGKLQAADGSLIPKEYSRDIMPLFDNINWSVAHKAKSVVYDRKVWLAVPYGNSATANNYVFVYHIDTEAWSVIPDLAIASWCVFEDINGEDVLYAGSADSPTIFKISPDINTFNEDIIYSIARTGKLNLGSIIDYEDLQTVALEGSMQTGDQLRLTIITDGVSAEYDIDDTFIYTSSDSSGYIASDFIAEEYIPTGEEASQDSDLRWLAVLLVNTTQRKAREIEIQLENLNNGARWSWDYLSINEIDFASAKLLPQNHIITSEVAS